MQIVIGTQEEEKIARNFSLYLKRITFEDAYRRTDCGYTEEKRKEQAYAFLKGCTTVEEVLNDELYRLSIKKNTEQQTQGVKR
jgi:hypothetical protein